MTEITATLCRANVVDIEGEEFTTEALFRLLESVDGHTKVTAGFKSLVAGNVKGIHLTRWTSLGDELLVTLDIEDEEFVEGLKAGTYVLAPGFVVLKASLVDRAGRRVQKVEMAELMEVSVIPCEAAVPPMQVRSEARPPYQKVERGGD